MEKSPSTPPPSQARSVFTEAEQEKTPEHGKAKTVRTLFGSRQDTTLSARDDPFVDPDGNELARRQVARALTYPAPETPQHSYRQAPDNSDFLTLSKEEDTDKTPSPMKRPRGRPKEVTFRLGSPLITRRTPSTPCPTEKRRKLAVPGDDLTDYPFTPVTERKALHPNETTSNAHTSSDKEEVASQLPCAILRADMLARDSGVEEEVV